MFETYNYFKQHNDGKEISDYKKFYRVFSNTREFGGGFTHLDHLVKNRFMSLMGSMVSIVLRRQPQTVLDIGCGLGVNLPLARLFNNVDYHGLDYADEALKKAREIYPMVTFHVGDAFNMPLPSKKYDLCILSSVLILYKELTDQQNLLKEASRVMTDDGLLVLIVWNDAILLRWSIKVSRIIGRLRKKQLPTDFMGVHFSNKEVTALCESASLDVVQLYNTSHLYGVLESVKYLNLSKYSRSFGAAEREAGSVKSANELKDLEEQSGGPSVLVRVFYAIARVAPSLFSMFTICVCKKKT